MSIIKLAPKNLAGIQHHFEHEKLNIQNKIQSAKKKISILNKEVISLEKELEICNDGIEWTDKVYEAGKK